MILKLFSNKILYTGEGSKLNDQQFHVESVNAEFSIAASGSYYSAIFTNVQLKNQLWNKILSANLKNMGNGKEIGRGIRFFVVV